MSGCSAPADFWKKGFYATYTPPQSSAVRSSPPSPNSMTAPSIVPRSSKKELPMFTPQQAKDFLAVAREHRLDALFALAITTGAREGELFGLTWDRVDLEAKWITCSGNCLLIG